SHDPSANNYGAPLQCPVQPALLVDAAVQGSGKGTAFHVVSDTPLSAYDILPYGGAHSWLPSATLLFPSTAWGTNSVGVAPKNEGYGALWALAVATEDGTHLTVAPPNTLPGGGGVAPAPSGASTTYKLDAGETIQWIDPNPGIAVDPTGAVFQSDKP